MALSLAERFHQFLADPQFKVARRIFDMLPLRLQNQLLTYYDDEGSGNNVIFCLQRLKDKGFSPGVVVDCGAYQGDWTKKCKRVFPEARVLMIEPQKGKQSSLAGVQARFAPTVDYVSCLVGEANKEQVAYFEMETGSSILEELSDVPRKIVNYPMRRLDDILKDKGFEGAQFIKMDLQGYEIEALKGAPEALKQADLVMLEVAFIPYNRNAPFFDEIVQFMKNRGFVLYDIIDLQRWKANTLHHVDALFVKSGSALRKIQFSFLA